MGEPHRGHADLPLGDPQVTTAPIEEGPPTWGPFRAPPGREKGAIGGDDRSFPPAARGEDPGIYVQLGSGELV